MADEKIYHFENPPLKETVLGVQFRPLPKLKSAHLGAFWKSLEPGWPTINDAPPLDAQIERFDQQIPIYPEFTLQFGGAPLPRVQVLNVTRDRMIQVQNGRVLYNWVRQPQGVYPHYSTIREAFEQVLQKFREYVLAEQIGELAPNQWDVTYVNHIPRGTVWQSPADWQSVFPGLAMPLHPTADTLLESFAGEWHYEIPDRRGRLHVQLRHGVLEKQQLLTMNLTARGPLVQGQQLIEGLDLGRTALVRTFKSLTSDAAHRYWGLIE